MLIDIQMVPIVPTPQELGERMVIVIDVLRATSVIIQALLNGATEVIPVTTVEEAFSVAAAYPAGTTLLGGERGSRRIEGFDIGNSPGEYRDEKVGGKRLILTTTNGTKAFHSVASAREVMAGSFYNIEATARRCIDSDREVMLFPSGDEGRFSLEDVVCGGMWIDRAKKMAKHVKLTDASRAALIIYQKFEANLMEAFRLSNHGKDLIALGLEKDLFDCSRIDITNVVPLYENGVIRMT